MSSATGLKTYKVLDLYWNFIRWVYDVATENIAVWECEEAGLTDYILIEVKQ